MTLEAGDDRSVTELLVDWRAGDDDALRELTPRIYDELRRLARRSVSRESPGQTLSATDLVHESFLRLIDADVTWQDRAHFMAVSARTMRRILIDRARAKGRAKRGSGARHEALQDLQVELAGAEPSIDLLDLDDAIQSLAKTDQRKAQVIELTFFGGMSYDEVAEALQISRATAHRDLTFAKAWLFSRLSAAGPGA